MAKKILVVEDDRDVSQLLRYNLEKEGFQVRSVNEGNSVLSEIRRDTPDVVLLDLMLPGLDGLEICRQIRKIDRFGGVSVVMLTARNEEADRVVGLEIGADDYITKPFSMRELIARIRAVLRRHEVQDSASAVIQRGPLVIDPMAHSVRVHGKAVELSALEFRLLHYLASHPGMVFSRNQILDRVWGDDRSVTPRSVDVYVRRVREKIELEPERPSHVQTVHGVGYRFSRGADD